MEKKTEYVIKKCPKCGSKNFDAYIIGDGETGPIPGNYFCKDCDWVEGEFEMKQGLENEN